MSGQERGRRDGTGMRARLGTPRHSGRGRRESDCQLCRVPQALPMDVLSQHRGDPRTVLPQVSPCQLSRGLREKQSCSVSAWSVCLSFSSWVKLRETW